MGTDSKIPDSAEIPEPPAGSVVLDRADYAWQRRTNSPDWYRTRGTHAWVWTELTDLRGPLTVVYTPRARSVYVIEQRTNLAAGGHAFQLLPAGFAYPSIGNAQAAVEHMAGAMRWNDRLEGRQPGDRLPLYRIVEVPLDTRGGVR